MEIEIIASEYFVENKTSKICTRTVLLAKKFQPGGLGNRGCLKVLNDTKG